MASASYVPDITFVRYSLWCDVDIRPTYPSMGSGAFDVASQTYLSVRDCLQLLIATARLSSYLCERERGGELPSKRAPIARAREGGRSEKMANRYEDMDEATLRQMVRQLSEGKFPRGEGVVGSGDA